MSKMRKDHAVIEQIIELSQRGMGNRAIARCLKISKNTVKRAIRERQKCEARGLEEALGPLPEGDGAIRCFGLAQPDGAPLTWAQKLNWEEIRKEYAKGATLKVLHQEHCEKAVSYWRFWREFRNQNPQTPAVTMRLNHVPGQKTFFDFADGIEIVDRKTGEVTKTQFLCGVLPFSSYTYGEFVPSQKQNILMGAVERAWHFFGGVTPYVTVDNLKAGVSKAHIYDPVVNPGFVEFANHWGFAVLPARPYRPRDKAANESAIGVIQRSFFAEVRNRTFYSIEELNGVLRDYLNRLNHQVMKEHGVSRSERFENERKTLKSLAQSNFESCEWKECRVHADCHVQLENRFYSVPFSFVGQTVRVRRSERLVEVFSLEREALAVHARLTGKARVSTQDEHYPDKKVGLTRFEVRHAKCQAERIGPKTQALVQTLLDQEYPLRYLRRVQGILRLTQSGQVDVASLEYACAQALTFGRMTYDYVKSSAKFYQVNGNRPVSVAPKRDRTEVHLHNP